MSVNTEASAQNQFHEQRLRAAIDRRTQAEPGSVNYRIPPHFVSCTDDGRSCVVRYLLKPEMRNPMGWLHGGMTSAMVDMSMGLLAYYNAGFVLCPTGSMTVNFLRPGRIGGSLMVESEITYLGHKIIHTRASAWMEDQPNMLVATATASYIVPSVPNKNQQPQQNSGKSSEQAEKI